MKNFANKTLILFFCAVLTPAIFALTLQEAKADGLVGEQRDGYVGLVVSSADAEVIALVQDINRQRREQYQQIAQRNGISVEQVAALAYEKAVGATPSGQFVQDTSGAWQRK